MTDQEKQEKLLWLRFVAIKVERLQADHGISPADANRLTGLNVDTYTEHYAIPVVKRDGYMFARA